MTFLAGNLLPEDPYLVPAYIEKQGGVELHIVNAMFDARDIVSGFMDRSPVGVGMRIMGGCAENQDRDAMLRFFAEAFQGDPRRQYRGFLSSGATTEVVVGADGRPRLNPIVCDVPAALLANDPEGIVTLSTVPRVGKLRLRDRSRLAMQGKRGETPLNPRVHCIVMVQPRESHLVHGWDGDAEDYFGAFNTYRVDRGWPFGTTVWNGGNVTYKEIILSAETYDWPTFLIGGSDRMADYFIRYLETGLVHREMPGDPELSDNARANLIVVHRDDPAMLRDKLVERRFIQVAA